MVLITAPMSGQEPVHPPAQLAVGLGPERNVEMVGHHTIGKQPRWMPERCLRHHLDEGLKVPILVEDPGASVSSIEDVVTVTAGRSSPGAWHGRLSDRRQPNRGERLPILCSHPGKLPVTPLNFSFEFLEAWEQVLRLVPGDPAALDELRRLGMVSA
jgi:hypothetical protein